MLRGRSARLQRLLGSTLLVLLALYMVSYDWACMIGVVWSLYQPLKWPLPLLGLYVNGR
jgi:hypothetical protein